MTAPELFAALAGGMFVSGVGLFVVYKIWRLLAWVVGFVFGFIVGFTVTWLDPFPEARRAYEAKRAAGLL